jgi:NAD(P)H dehydrogenase (quinone)
LAAEISKQTGKNIPYQNLPKAEYAGVLAKFGLPEGLAGLIVGWDISIAKRDLFNDSKQLSTLTGRPPTPISEAVGQAVK